MIEVASCWRLSCHHARAIVRLDPKCVEMPYHKRSLTKRWSHQTVQVSASNACYAYLPMFRFGHFLVTAFGDVFFFCRGSWSKVSFNWIHLVKSFMKGWNASWPGTLAASRIDRPRWELVKLGTVWGLRVVSYLEVEVPIGNSTSFLHWQTPSAAFFRPSGLQMNSGDEENALADMGGNSQNRLKKIWAIKPVSQWVRPFCWVLLFVSLTPLNLPYCWIFEWC